MFLDETIKHLEKFISGIWQIHPFFRILETVIAEMNFHVENELEVENIMKLESRMELKLYREPENEFDEGQLYD